MKRLSNILCTMALVGLPMSAIAANDGAVKSAGADASVTGSVVADADVVADVAAEKNDGAVKNDGAAKASKVVEHLQNHYKFYGFIRNYMAYDSRESVSGTGDLFYYLPKDENLNDLGEDLNRADQFRYLSLTTRVGVDVSGYVIRNTAISAKVEGDFYAGVSGVTGTAQLRLRQAYMKFAWNDLKMGQSKSVANVSLLMGQAWHPMAADLCPVISLASGAPFGPFSRTPQVTMEAWLGEHFALTASALWQMQYTSAGPSGSSANYIKYACTPEAYIGFTAKAGGFMARTGLDILSIKPRNVGDITYETENVLGTVKKTTKAKVSDRITTFSPFLYMQYVKGKFSVKGKTIFAAAGEHMNIQGGYGVTEKFTGTGEDGHYEYTPTYSSSTWFTVSYGKKWQPSLMLGYYENLGTFKDLYSTRDDGKVEEGDFYFSKNSFKNLNRMYRIVPYVCYNIGKFTVGLEYELTAAQFGTPETENNLITGKRVLYNSRGLATDGLHWVMNHRVQAMFKFNF